MNTSDSDRRAVMCGDNLTDFPKSLLETGQIAVRKKNSVSGQNLDYFYFRTNRTQSREDTSRQSFCAGGHRNHQ